MPARIILGRETQRQFHLGNSSLLSLVPHNYFRSDFHWNFPAGASEIIPFGARSDRLWDLQSPEIPSRVFLLVFPRWGLPWLLVRKELHFPTLGVYCYSPFLGNYISFQMKHLKKAVTINLIICTGGMKYRWGEYILDLLNFNWKKCMRLLRMFMLVNSCTYRIICGGSQIQFTKRQNGTQ